MTLYMLVCLALTAMPLAVSFEAVAQSAHRQTNDIDIKVETQWKGRLQDRKNLKSQIVRDKKDFRLLWEGTHPEKEPIPDVSLDGKAVLFIIAASSSIEEPTLLDHLSLNETPPEESIPGLVGLFTIKADSKRDKGHAFLFAVLAHPLKAREIEDLQIDKRPGRFRVEKSDSGQVAYSINEKGEAEFSGVWTQTQGVVVYRLK